MERALVSDPFLVGVFFGFVPAMGFLYILFKEYQGFYNEKKLFRSFFIGMGVGLLITIAESFAGPGPRAAEGLSPAWLGLFAALLAGLEMGAFAVVLNWKTYRGKRDAPYYAVAFGLGFGSTNVIFLVGSAVAGLEAAQVGVAEAVFVTILGLYFIGSILVHATVGGWIGRGVSRGGLVGELVLAVLVRALYLGGFYAMFRLRSPTASIAIPFVALGAGILLVAHLLRDVLARVVPPEVLREMEIHQRRLAREVVRTQASDPPPGETPRQPPKP